MPKVKKTKALNGKQQKRYLKEQRQKRNSLHEGEAAIVCKVKKIQGRVTTWGFKCKGPEGCDHTYANGWRNRNDLEDRIIVHMSLHDEGVEDFGPDGLRKVYAPGEDVPLPITGTLPVKNPAEVAQQQQEAQRAAEAAQASLTETYVRTYESVAEVLEDLKVDELKAECKRTGITGYSKMKKNELIEAIARKAAGEAVSAEAGG